LKTKQNLINNRNKKMRDKIKRQYKNGEIEKEKKE
jgi:hypothetical protein